MSLTLNDEQTHKEKWSESGPATLTEITMPCLHLCCLVTSIHRSWQVQAQYKCWGRSGDSQAWRNKCRDHSHVLQHENALVHLMFAWHLYVVQGANFRRMCKFAFSGVLLFLNSCIFLQLKQHSYRVFSLLSCFLPPRHMGDQGKDRWDETKMSGKKLDAAKDAFNDNRYWRGRQLLTVGSAVILFYQLWRFLMEFISTCCHPRMSGVMICNVSLA